MKTFDLHRPSPHHTLQTPSPFEAAFMDQHLNDNTMTFEDRAGLVLATAQVLYENGQSTDQVLSAASRCGSTLELRAEILPRWGELQLKAEDTAKGTRLISAVAANPTGVAMSRVAAVMRTIDDLAAGR